MINRQSLAEEFGIEAERILQDIQNATGQPTIDNPNEWIEKNIEKANKLLDKVIHESENGNFSPRMAEVGSLLVNSINIAFEKINTKKMGESSLQIKRDLLKLKERELDIKERSLDRPQFQQNNILFTDREAVLKFLKGEQNRMLENNKDVIEIKEEKNADE